MSDKNNSNLAETLGDVAKTMGEAAGNVTKAMGEAAGDMAQRMGEVAGNTIKSTAEVGQNMGESVGLLDRDEADETAGESVTVTAEGTGILHAENDAPSAEGTSC
ncbi:MAG: hypothetical protein KY468_06280 [Armatimonadetes bacterium]|nr:hypothetical protein [Armatimonadota bacterium]